MGKMKRILIFICLLMVSFSIVACNDSVEPIGISISSVDDVRNISVGKTLQLKATVHPNDDNQEIVWSSLDDSVATVNEEGLVTGVKIGKTYIVAGLKDNENISQKFAIIVEYAAKEEVNPSRIEVTSVNGKTTFKVGETLSLVANVTPEDASKRVKWSSSDSSIASVSGGNVVALKTGEVTITATSKLLDTVYGYIVLTIEPGDKPAVSEEWASMDVTSHADFLTTADGSKVKIQGVATSVSEPKNGKVNYYLQNGDEGYYVYSQDISKYPVEEGKAYEVGGEKKVYQGLHEIMNVAHSVELDEEFEVNYVTPTGVDISNATESAKYLGSFVSVDATIVSGTVNTDKTFSLTISVGGKNIALNVDTTFAKGEFEDICNKLKGVVGGASMKVKGILTCSGYGTPKVQILLVNANDIECSEATPKEIINACLTTLVITTKIGFSINNIELPTTVAGFNDVEITWSSNSEFINVSTGVVTHAATSVTATLTATLSYKGESATKEFDVVIDANDGKEYEVVASLDLEDAGPLNSYGCSETKGAYAAAVVELGTPKHKWLLHNALIAGSSSDRFEGSKSLRAKSGTSAEATARIEIQDAGEYNVVEFLAGVYGEHVLGTQIRVEYTDANGNWVAHSDVITLNSHQLETFRVMLPEGVKKVALVVVENTGKTVNIDSIKLMK